MLVYPRETNMKKKRRWHFQQHLYPGRPSFHGQSSMLVFSESQLGCLGHNSVVIFCWSSSTANHFFLWANCNMSVTKLKYCYFGIVAQIENPYSSEVTVRPTWIFHDFSYPQFTYLGRYTTSPSFQVGEPNIRNKVEPRLTTSFHGHVSHVFGCFDLLASIHRGDEETWYS